MADTSSQVGANRWISTWVHFWVQHWLSSGLQNYHGADQEILASITDSLPWGKPHKTEEALEVTAAKAESSPRAAEEGDFASDRRCRNARWWDFHKCVGETAAIQVWDLRDLV